MGLMVTELYDALRKAGVDEQLARDAARAVLSVDAVTDFATKTDLAELRADIAQWRAEMNAQFAQLKLEFAELTFVTKANLAEFRGSAAELKADLIKWNVGAMAVLTAIFAAIARLT